MPTYACPICHLVTRVDRPEQAPFRPFCSQRCKLVDLGRWLDGTYAITEPLESPRREDAEPTPP